MRYTPNFSHSELKGLLSYDPDTGIFRRLKSSARAKAGAVAGYVDKNGYVRVSVGGFLVWAHRLAWFYSHGEWPSKFIDHINRNPADNRLVNLRDVPHSINMRNRAAYGQVPLLGVTQPKDRKSFRAQITRDRKTKHLGRFKTAEAAHQAYLVASRNQ